MSSPDHGGDLSPEQKEIFERWKKRAAEQPKIIDSKTARDWGINPIIEEQRKLDEERGPVKGMTRDKKET